MALQVEKFVEMNENNAFQAVISHKLCDWLEWNHCNTSVTICV
jgi:hypothetical protein